jgi:hypothetical protein
MKTNLLNLAHTSLRKFSIAAAVLGMLSAATTRAAVVFDNMSIFEAGNTNSHVTSTGSTPNTFMGDGYVLAAGTTAITGFDLYPVNLSGTSYTGLKLNIYVWGTVNTGTVNATTPAFGNLLGSYTFTETGSFTTGFYFPLESGTPGTPGIALSTPLAISSTTIGVSLNFQGTTDGVNYASINSLTSLIQYGTAPTVGSQMFNGYYRNANSEVDGNFTSTLRSLGQTNQSLGLRIYGTSVPEPTTLALLGAGGVLLFLRRRA